MRTNDATAGTGHTPRCLKDGPFCWQTKTARRLIRDSADGFPRQLTPSAALGVYDALTEIASDEQSERFAVAQDWIALKAALTRKTVQRALPVLRELGLIWYSEPQGMRVRIKYLLIALGPSYATKGPSDPTLGPRELRSTDPTSEESPKESPKESPEQSCAEPAAAAPAPPVLVFPTVGNPHEWALTEPKLAEYRESYPALDMMGQCRQALQWIRDNPPRRKTARGMTRFLGAWLARAQNARHPTIPSQQAKAMRDDDQREQARVKLAQLDADRLAIMALHTTDDPEVEQAKRDKLAEIDGKIARLKGTA